MIDASVIVATHNRAALVARCIDCLLAQSYPRQRYEIIVIDDGSQDDTQQRLQAHAKAGLLHYLCLPNQIGAGPARNAGLERAQGAIVIFVDSDAFTPPHFIAAHADAHRRSSRCVVDGPAINITVSPLDGVLPFKSLRVRLLAALGFGGVPFITVNASCRLDDIRRLGGFDAAFSTRYGWEDTELFMRFKAAGLRRVRERAAWLLHAGDADRDLQLRGRRRFECGLNAPLLYARHPGDETLRLLDIDAPKWLERMSRLGLDAERVERWCLEREASPLKRRLLTPIYLRQQYALGLLATGWPDACRIRKESA
ncbi:MAG TPA: glycosyltransferase [Vicinamibacterales bacterium]|nr:glycosyltransferase [Vicinamibacterales bacterium]